MDYLKKQSSSLKEIGDTTTTLSPKDTIRVGLPKLSHQKTWPKFHNNPDDITNQYAPKMSSLSFKILKTRMDNKN